MSADASPGRALSELHADNLSDLVFESIRTAIVNRSLAPGSRLTETKLAEELNVSKTPVREALVKLRQVGLIEPDGRRGGRVIRPSRTTVQETYDLREALEVFTARRAAEIASEPGRSTIGAAAQRSLDAARSGDLDGFHANDERFHDAVADAAGNARVREHLANAFALIVTLRHRDLPDQETSIECGRAHVAIAAAIADGDADAAERQMREHIRLVRDAVVAGLSGVSR